MLLLLSVMSTAQTNTQTLINSWKASVDDASVLGSLTLSNPFNTICDSKMTKYCMYLFSYV